MSSLLVVFDEDGNYKFKFGTKGRGDGQMSFPEGIGLGYSCWSKAKKKSRSIVGLRLQ